MESIVLVHPWKTDVAVIVIVIGNYMVEYITLEKVLNCGESGKKMSGKIKSGGRSGEYSPSESSPPFAISCTFVVFSFGFRLQTLANVVHATVSEDRTLHRTQHTRTFLSLRTVYYSCFASQALALAQGLMNQVSMCVAN